MKIFVKIGNYDPYTDDPRFALQRVLFDSSGTLICGGSAGQVMVYDFKESNQLLEVKNSNQVITA